MIGAREGPVYLSLTLTPPPTPQYSLHGSVHVRALTHSYVYTKQIHTYVFVCVCSSLLKSLNLRKSFFLFWLPVMFRIGCSEGKKSWTASFWQEMLGPLETQCLNLCTTRARSCCDGRMWALPRQNRFVTQLFLKFSLFFWGKKGLLFKFPNGENMSFFESHQLWSLPWNACRQLFDSDYLLWYILCIFGSNYGMQLTARSTHHYFISMTV